MKFYKCRNFRNFKTSELPIFRKEFQIRVFVSKPKGTNRISFLKRTLFEVLKLLKFFRGINFIRIHFACKWTWIRFFVKQDDAGFAKHRFHSAQAT